MREGNPLLFYSNFHETGAVAFDWTVMGGSRGKREPKLEGCSAVDFATREGS